MKLAVLATFLFIAAVAALPVEEINVPGNLAAVHRPPGHGHEDEEQQAADDLKTDATFWGGGWGGYRHYGGYGGWGGYYNP